MLKVGNTSIIMGREDGVVLGLEGTMKGLQINTKFQPCGLQLNLTLNLDALSVRSKLPILTLRSLLINSKVINDITRCIICILYICSTLLTNQINLYNISCTGGTKCFTN